MRKNILNQSELKSLPIKEFKQRDIEKFPLLQISRKVLNTEGKLYLSNQKERWKSILEVLKIYYNQDSSYLNRKIYIII